MLASTLETITKLIQSPPGQLAAGAALAGIVWKFFERVEGVLKDQTKLEVAAWLVGVRVGPKVAPWPGTFTSIFDQVFGARHFSWKCFWRSALASLLVGVIGLAILLAIADQRYAEEGTSIVDIVYSVAMTVAFGQYLAVSAALHPWLVLTHLDQGDIFFNVFIVLLTLTVMLVTNILPDYLSLLETRFILRLMQRSKPVTNAGLLVFDGIVTVASSLAWNTIVFRILQKYSTGELPNATDLVSLAGMWFVYPALFTSLWLWLYAGSGFLLKAARRFDLGFDWFNRKFDIEKKPLQSIGFVAGAIVAVAYWSVALVSRVW